MANLSTLAVLRPLAIDRYTTSSPSTAAGVSLVGYTNSGGRAIKGFGNLANVAGTTPSVTIKFQDSADDSTYADITTPTTAAFTAATTNGALTDIYFTTTKKYVRAVATFTSATTSADIAVGIIVEKRNV